jgi:hypothetical protein
MLTSVRQQRRKIRSQWKHWERLCRNYRRLIRDCKSHEQLHGTKWVDGMVRHYSSLLQRVEAAEPEKFE